MRQSLGTSRVAYDTGQRQRYIAHALRLDHLNGFSPWTSTVALDGQSAHDSIVTTRRNSHSRVDTMPNIRGRASSGTLNLYPSKPPTQPKWLHSGTSHNKLSLPAGVKRVLNA